MFVYWMSDGGIDGFLNCRRIDLTTITKMSCHFVDGISNDLVVALKSGGNDATSVRAIRIERRSRVRSIRKVSVISMIRALYGFIGEKVMERYFD